MARGFFSRATTTSHPSPERLPSLSTPPVPVQLPGMYDDYEILQFWLEFGCSRQTMTLSPFISRNHPRFAQQSSRTPCYARTMKADNIWMGGMRPPSISLRPSVVSDPMLPRGRPCSASMDCPQPFIKPIKLRTLIETLGTRTTRASTKPSKVPPPSAWRKQLGGQRLHLRLGPVDNGFASVNPRFSDREPQI